MTNEFKIKLIELAAFYEKSLTDEQLKVYAQYLIQRITISEFAIAIGKYCDDSKNEFFPRPISKLVALVHEPVDDDAQARDAAGRIVHAISKYGWCNVESARNYVGELGWAVVSKQGGWVNLCEASRTMNLETFQAQSRDLAKSQIKMARAGLIDTPPGLPARDNVAALTQSSPDKQRKFTVIVKDLNEAIK